MAFVNSVTANCVTVNLSKINKESSIKQDPRTTNDSARLYIHISLMPVLNKTGLGTSPLIKRKNASYRDSIINIDETVFIRSEFIITRRLVSLIIALILTEVITSVNLKNLFVDFTKKE
jgi:hypothetical protein